MQTFTYGAIFEAGDKTGIVVSFPDVPEAITQGDDMTDALLMAEDSLGLALLSYPARGLVLPKPRSSASFKGQKLRGVTVPPEVAAKLAVLSTFAASGLSKSELGRRLGKDEKEVRRILDPKHPTKIGPLTAALKALGKRLVIGVADEAA